MELYDKDESHSGIISGSLLPTLGNGNKPSDPPAALFCLTVSSKSVGDDEKKNEKLVE